jgi:hypothetical protein
MALSKVTANGITDNAVTTAKIACGAVEESDLAANAVTSAKITDGTIAAADLNSTVDLSGKTVTLPLSATSVVDQNIALLGFKMAVNEGLTVFNLVDGIVDEFHDESGTDEGEGTNDTYCSSNDNYVNQASPVSNPANFTVSTVTEATTSAAGTNPAQGTICRASFTVPTGVTSVTVRMFGGGGGVGNNSQNGGGGGFVEGEAAVTASQVLDIYVGEGGGGDSEGAPSPPTTLNGGGVGGGFGTGPEAGGGGAGSFIFASETASANDLSSPDQPKLFMAAGGGGGGGELSSGGSGGGLIGNAGGTEPGTEQVSANGENGGGGDQEQGGSGPIESGAFEGAPGNPQQSNNGGGGSGYYGGGGGDSEYSGGGGSSYYGHPQVTGGATEDGEGASGTPGSPGFTSNVGKGGNYTSPGYDGYDGFVLLDYNTPGATTSTTIVSNAFTASSAPSTSRIVVFQENVATPTLNTDIIASISRDGGSTFTTATLADSGYVTGSSGQRILTGTATVSGQPSGTNMRWKLALANNAVKIHGVSLQWK